MKLFFRKGIDIPQKNGVLYQQHQYLGNKTLRNGGGEKMVYTMKEVAEKLKVSQETIRKEAKEGNIKYSVVGKSKRFTEEHITEYLNRG